MKSDVWYVYMVECSDGTIYTGITNDINERIHKHNIGKGAKYTRARLPVTLKAFWMYDTKSAASKEEYAFKKLTREKKLEMIRACEYSINSHTGTSLPNNDGNR